MTLLCLSLSSCSSDKHVESIRTVTDDEAEKFSNELLDDLVITKDDNLEISLWASEKLLGDPGGINIDNEGRVWVSTTNRRRTSVPDAGVVSKWFIDNLSWTSVEDRSKFLRQVLTPERGDENPWLADFNEDGVVDWRDMAIETDSVFMLEDISQNGYANQARVMDWDIYSEVTEITGSVLLHDGDLFVVRSPDVLRIRDSNGDGKWNKAESISHGYGVHFGYSGHGISSLRVGPDGRIYWSMGDIGLNITDKEGKKWYDPHIGAILRSDPDGSNFEVFATGLRNVHEFDFDKYGNLIGIDNDGPRGDYDRLVYVVNGSDSGWRIYWQMGKYNDPKNNDYSIWVNEGYFKTSFPGQAAHVLPALAPSYRGPAGFAYNPGSALSDEWNDYFFASSFVGSPTQSGINAFTLNEKGAAFEVDTSRTVLRGLLSTSLGFSPDGSLYTTDWIEGWATKGTGRIWKIDTPPGSRMPSREQTRDLLGEDFKSRTSDELMWMLAYDDMRVRKKAQFELVKRDEMEYLLKALENDDDQMARIHGIWGLAQAGRRDAEKVKPLISFLNDSDPEIRAQTAKMLGDVRFAEAGDALVPLLKDDNARVRFFAAEALGRIGMSDAVDPITEMIRDNDDEDVYLRHAGAIALGRIGDAQFLSGLAEDPSKAVRIAALIALKRMKSPEIVQFLNDSDEAIVTDAARSINDEDFIVEGLSELANMLLQDNFTNDALLRRAINANLYSGTYQDAERLASFSLREDVSDEIRIESLQALAGWPDPSLLDRVSGRYRGPLTNNPDFARRAAEPAFVRILTGKNSSVKIAALQAAGDLDITASKPAILNLVQDDTDADVRIASLNALQALSYEAMDEILSAALVDESPDVRMNALRVVPEAGLSPESAVSLLVTVLESGNEEEQQTALNTLGIMDDPASYAALDRQLDLLISGELAKEAQLDLILAIEAMSSEALHAKLARYQSAKPAGDRLAQYEEAIYGGDAEAGRRIFANHANAQCFRCHGGDGDAGPDLESIGSLLSRQEILQAMVDPNARVAPGFGVVTLNLKNGNDVRGVLSVETASHVILIRDGEMLEYSKADIEEQRSTPSQMPAMGNILTRNELRDLVEYLANLK